MSNGVDSESSTQPLVRSELPLVSISYDAGREWAYEGGYPETERLPIEPEQSMGVKFEMDNMKFAIDGDLGGHVVYHRIRQPSKLYHMPWTTFVDFVENDTIRLEM